MRSALILTVILMSPGLGMAIELQDLDPTTRLIQSCDVEAMERIGKGPGKLQPDRAMIDALSRTTIVEDVASGEGAIRSGGRWFRFEFECATSPDHLRIERFSYKLGDEIPKDQWEQLGLFD